MKRRSAKGAGNHSAAVWMREWRRAMVPKITPARARFADFMRYTLGPDLVESGREYTGADVKKCGRLIRAGKTDGEFARFLKGTLVPDLRASGQHETAKDLAKCARYITPKRKRRR
jgi:hypothetical protein